MRKMDEMERNHTGIAARYAFAFTTLALIIWSIINYFENHETGWQFTIAMVGLFIFFITRAYYGRKIK